ncbi:MAG: ATP-binding protein [Candidatus Thorarchaeota archaeon]
MQSLINPLSYLQEIGCVIATETSPTTTKIDGIIKNQDIQIVRGEILEIPYSDKEIMIVIVREIHKSNNYFSNADVLKEQSLLGRNNTNLFPIDEWATTFLYLAPLGVFTENGIKRVQIPVSPGASIYKARWEILKIFFGFSSQHSGIHLGNLIAMKTPVYIDLSRLFRKHLAVLAISGAGKSYTVAILIEEILKRSKEIGRLPVIIIDPHGEYTYLMKEYQNNFSIKSIITVYSGNFFSIASQNLTAWSIREFAPEISSVQIRELDRIITQLKKTNSLNSFNDIISEVEISPTLNNRTRESLLGWLDMLSNFHIFKSTDFPLIKDLLSPGQISILDLSGIHSYRKKQVICAHIARRSFELRRTNQVSPYLLIIEEAHQFCPEQETSIAKSIIETIAREGRKFFASLCLISQRPVKLSSTALSQCNSHLIMKVKNPYDLDYLGRLSEGIDKDTLRLIPDLETGEAMLVGEAVNFPVLLKIRQKMMSESNFDKQSIIEELNAFESK